MKKIGIIGTGNMGEAIVKALVKAGFKKGSLLIAEKNREKAQYMEKSYGTACSNDLGLLADKSDYIILAVKPQDARYVMGEIGTHITGKKVLISIMAGITTSTLLSLAEKQIKIVRIMPNICAKIGEGAMGITSNTATTGEERDAVKEALAPLGSFFEVTEELMDAVTALGGSGPAFLLSFLEAMIDAGVKTGLPRDKARAIVLQVTKGTVKMLDEEGLHPAVLRDMITSPGGTTIAGITALEERAFNGSVIEAVEMACKRAKELSS